MLGLGTLRLVVRKGGGWRWPLSGATEGLEIWRGTECVGTISADLLTLIVASYLQDTALRESVRLELLAVARRPSILRRKR